MEDIHTVIRPYEDMKKHLTDPTIGTTTDYGKDLVVNIPFNGDVKVKSITVCGGPDGQAPARVKLYKNEVTVDIDLVHDKKP